MAKIIQFPFQERRRKTAEETSPEALDAALSTWVQTPAGKESVRMAHKAHWESLSFWGKARDLWLRLVYRLKGK